MKKSIAKRTARFLTELMYLGVMKFSDDIFEGNSKLNFKALTAEEAQQLFYVGDKVFHYGHKRTAYDVLLVADSIILVVSDIGEQAFNSIEIK